MTDLNSPLLPCPAWPRRAVPIAAVPCPP